MAKKATNNDKLQNALVLFNYMLNIFGCKDLEALSCDLKDPAYEGVNDEGISNMFYALKSHLFFQNVTEEQALEYDRHIVRFTNEINAKRREKIQWKYYQYLTLLFTEIYLDRYFSDRQGFLNDLNDYLNGEYAFQNDTWQGIPAFEMDDLNKLAFWCATGSGKTLMMHAHIKQFLFYAEKFGKRSIINNIILLTPNEELSKQHLDELRSSNISAEIFTKGGMGGFFQGHTVQIIDINKLAETNGDKTVAVSSFEENNLVLIDEAHKGSGGNVWMDYRNQLTNNGFSFEYSATFGQAIGALGKKDKEELLRVYGKSTLFDYSYRYFYKDGFGKDYRIMNMEDWKNQSMLAEYLTAYILCLYEQKLVFNEDARIQKDFLIDNPLGVFVGGSVSASKSGNDWDGNNVSDVVMIILFLKDFLSNKTEYCRYIMNILNGTTALTYKGNPIFNNSFKKLKKDYKFNVDESKADEIYKGILKLVFQTEIQGTLHVDYLKNLDGEIGLKVGDSDYFGLVYVGDGKKVFDMCVVNEINSFELSYQGRSLFADITSATSQVNILIGSKKFTEGWSCWRVSLMGLMNFGKSEGSQIIQMFGRGVRLKGYKMSLKRSSALDLSIKPDVEHTPKNIQIMETLNIFGVRSDYMKDFENYLKDSGLPSNDSNFMELTIKTLQTCPPDLKVIRTDREYNFKKKVVVRLKDLKKSVSVTVDWYPKINLLYSKGRDDAKVEKHIGILTKNHLCILDWTKIFFEIEQFKNERSWYNMEIDQDELYQIMLDDSWYKLSIPEEELRFTDFGKNVAEWQEIVIALLKGYVDKAYKNCRGKNEAEHQQVEILKPSDPNFISEYKIKVSLEKDGWVQAIQAIVDKVDKNDLTDMPIIEKNQIEAITFDKHLYNPVLYLNESYKPKTSDDDASITIAPVALNNGEKRLMEDIRRYYEVHGEGKEIYLLRNMSRKGIGFFENAGFYPDFLLWVKDGEKQYLTFIDPKGISHLKGLNDEKIQLFKRLKDSISEHVDDKTLILNSFIISNTDERKVDFWGEHPEFTANHVLFQDDANYVNTMFDMVMKENEIA